MATYLKTFISVVDFSDINFQTMINQHFCYPFILMQSSHTLIKIMTFSGDHVFAKSLCGIRSCIINTCSFPILKIVTYLTKEHLILRRSQKRTTTTAKYRALPVHEGSSQRRWTEVTSARPRRGSSSGELWRRRLRWNAHICCRRRLKGTWHRVKVLLYLPAWYINIYTHGQNHQH